MEEFSFSLNENEGHATICIDEYKGRSEKVIVPPSIGGIPVTAIGDSTFSNRENIKQVILPEGLVSIGGSAFAHCAALASINLPEGLASIGSFAFADCAALSGIIFPEDLVSIGCHAFSGCTALTDINLPEGLASIGGCAFKNCPQLTNINLPKGLVDIDYAPFADCSKLTEFTVDENNPVFTAVDGVLFDKTMTSLISFPAGKKGDYAIPDGVFNVEYRAFEGCNEITSIHIPQSVVDYKHFVGERLAGITVSEQNQVYSDIDGVLFNKAMTSLISFPAGKKGDYAIPDGAFKVDLFAFEGCNEITSIHIPKSGRDGIYILFQSERLTSITASKQNPVYSDIDGVLFNKEGTILKKYPQGRENNDYIVPDGVTIIGSYAFEDCKCLADIILPEGLQFIQELVFKDCEQLTAVTLPMSLKYIGKDAFENCSNLETITLSRKTRIAYKALEGFSGKLVYRD